MRIAINCRSFQKKQYTGIGRYAYHLVQSLAEIDQTNEYILYAKKDLFDFKRQVPVAPGKNFTVKVDRFNRKVENTVGPYDVYHSPSPAKTGEKKGKVVITIHDLIHLTYPQGHTTDTIELSDKYIKHAIQVSDKIICCSQSTIDDVLKHYNFPKEKLALVYQGVDKELFYPLRDEEKPVLDETLKSLGIDGNYIFFVGTIEPRKNLDNLLKAYAILRAKDAYRGKLVIAGMKGWMSEHLERTMEILGIRRDIILLGYLSNEQLRLLYGGADVFTFPSFYEGFGFPIVEAFSCGAPVVTSNISSCPEVAGDAAVTVDPNEPTHIADAILHIVEDPDFRTQLIQKGALRAKDFSFQKTAEETLKVYEGLYES